MSAPKGRPCKACGVQIIFAKSEKTGKTLPLARVRSVYSIRANGFATKALDPEGDIYVSHYETCPSASEFTRKKK